MTFSELEEHALRVFERYAFAVRVTCVSRVAACRAGCVHTLGGDAGLRRLAAAAREAQPDNAFHNVWHIVDVLHATWCLVEACAVSLPPADTLSLLLAALLHDAAHPGTSNAFEAATGSRLAAGGGASPLERHHAACALRLLSQCRVLDGCAPSVGERVRSLLPALVLATDLGANDAHAAAYRAWLAQPAGADATPLLAMILKVADISNAAKRWSTARAWAGLLAAEHALLVAREVEARLPPSPFLTQPMPTLCSGFILTFGQPMLALLSTRVPWVGRYPSMCMLENVKRWQEEGSGAQPPRRPQLGGVELLCVANHTAGGIVAVG